MLFSTGGEQISSTECLLHQLHFRLSDGQADRSGTGLCAGCDASRCAVLLGELVAGALLTVMAAPTAKLGDSLQAFSEIVAARERGALCDGLRRLKPSHKELGQPE